MRHGLTRLLAAVGVVMAAGCESTPTIPVAASPTGGVRLEMLRETGLSAAALYRVEPDGTISFGGGWDAREGDTSWTGPMTAEEIQQLLGLLETHDWYGGSLAATGEPEDISYQLRVEWPDGKERYRLTGEGSGVTPVYELLESISRRRNEAFLDRLPKAGEQIPDRP